MKKILMAALVVSVAVLASSCKKESGVPTDVRDAKVISEITEDDTAAAIVGEVVDVEGGDASEAVAVAEVVEEESQPSK